jgi:hypothetical protein
MSPAPLASRGCGRPFWHERVNSGPIARCRVRDPRGYGCILIAEIARSVARRAEVFRTGIWKVKGKCR